MSIHPTSSRPQRILRATSSVLGVVFLFAAASKAANPAGVRNVLAYLFGASDFASFVSLSALIAMEVALGVSLVSRWRPRLVLSMTLTALLGFTVIVARLMTDTAAPKCGCTGESLLQLNAVVSNGVALGRNLLLIGVATLGLSATFSNGGISSAEKAQLPSGR